MTTEYIAKDGKHFNSKSECAHYESLLITIEKSYNVINKILRHLPTYKDNEIQQHKLCVCYYDDGDSTTMTPGSPGTILNILDENEVVELYKLQEFLATQNFLTIFENDNFINNINNN